MRLLHACRRVNFARFSTISRTSQTTILDNAKISDAKYSSITPVFKQAVIHNKKIALKDQNGEFSYFDLVAGSNKLSSEISDIVGKCFDFCDS